MTAACCRNGLRSTTHSGRKYVNRRIPSDKFIAHVALLLQICCTVACFVMSMSGAACSQMLTFNVGVSAVNSFVNGLKLYNCSVLVARYRGSAVCKLRYFRLSVSVRPTITLFIVKCMYNNNYSVQNDPSRCTLYR